MEKFIILEKIKESYITMKRKKEFLKTKMSNIEIGNVEQSNKEFKELKVELDILINEIKYFESYIICYS